MATFTEIFTLIDYDIDYNNPNVIKLIIKPLGSRYANKMVINGVNVIHTKYFKYKGIDRGSFMAGFKMAIAEIEKNIPQSQLNKINFLQNHVTVHMEANGIYSKWNSIIKNKKNNP